MSHPAWLTWPHCPPASLAPDVGDLPSPRGPRLLPGIGLLPGNQTTAMSSWQIPDQTSHLEQGMASQKMIWLLQAKGNRPTLTHVFGFQI